MWKINREWKFPDAATDEPDTVPKCPVLEFHAPCSLDMIMKY